MNRRIISSESLVPAGLALVAFLFSASARADMVTDWNANAEQAIVTAAAGTPVQGRVLAIVHAAIYDAVNNGRSERSTPLFATSGTARRFAEGRRRGGRLHRPAQPVPGTEGDARCTARRLAGGDPREQASQPAHRSRARLGESVANQILDWRATDGFTTAQPPYYGGGAPGVWRSPPTATNADGTLPALFPQFAVMLPFAMTGPDQFRPDPPPALTSALRRGSERGQADRSLRQRRAHARSERIWRCSGRPSDR